MYVALTIRYKRWAEKISSAALGIHVFHGSGVAIMFQRYIIRGTTAYNYCGERGKR